LATSDRSPVRGAILEVVAPLPESESSQHHAVQFYADERSLYQTVATFLGEGLVDGQPAILIATPTHRKAIVEHLSARLIDVERARRLGDLVLLDAEEMLSLFMVGGTPNRALFELTVGILLDQAVGGRPHANVRAYGEMVDLLWKAGRLDAAIELETLWNELADRRRFALLCGYAMGHFYKQPRLLEDVCAQHSHVMMPEINHFAPNARRVHEQ
jgi:DcmR-like sensory protein